MELDDDDNARNINQAYTISSANTWEKKVLTFDADGTGAFGNDNGDSFRILWWLGSGSSFSSGSLQTAWGATDNTKRAVGNVNLADSTDNDWSITGVQLEVGEYTSTTIPPFQHECYGDSLARCQRYFQNIEASRANASGFGQVESSTVHIQLPLSVNPRILAQYQGSGTFTKVGAIAVNAFSSTTDNITGVSFWVVMGNSVIVGMTTSGSTTNGAV